MEAEQGLLSYPPAAVKDVCDFAFDFLQELVVREGFLLVVTGVSAPWVNACTSWYSLSQLGLVLNP